MALVGPKVFIVDGDRDYKAMFRRFGWAIVDRIKDADLVQFTGGADVSPIMYGESRHPYTCANPQRDQYEAAVFATARKMKMPMAGICRGGQFLNVMSGGKMWQHVDKHNITGEHEAYDALTNSVVRVSSTHHQMMRPSNKAEILMTARRSTKKERIGDTGNVLTIYSDDRDVEACFYGETESICYQPHPEFGGDSLDACRLVFFNYLEYHFGLRAGGGK